jgi:dTMP kinase
VGIHVRQAALQSLRLRSMDASTPASASGLSPTIPFMTGIFISFEGIDGAGKSSHIEALAQAFRLAASGRQVVLTREPGGTALSERLRELILHEPMDALTEALLVFAARREHILQVIAPALWRGDVVLCDRFTDASFAYQGAGRGFDHEMLSKLEQTTQYLRRETGDFATKKSAKGILQPDLTLLFEIPPHIAAQRLAQARQPDKFESQDAAFFERVAGGYAARVAADPQRFVRINGHQSLQEVRSDVMTAVKAKGYL